MPSNRIKGQFMMLAADHVLRQHDTQSRPAHELAQPIVVRKVVRQDLQAADRSQSVSSEADRLTRHIAPVTEKPCEYHRGHVPLIDIHGAQARPNLLSW